MEPKDAKSQEPQFEAISALVDDELSISEKSALLADIKENPDLQEKWRHFTVIKTIMQQHRKSGLSTDEFVRKVMVHADGAQNSPRSTSKPEH